MANLHNNGDYLYSKEDNQHDYDDTLLIYLATGLIPRGSAVIPHGTHALFRSYPADPAIEGLAGFFLIPLSALPFNRVEGITFYQVDKTFSVCRAENGYQCIHRIEAYHIIRPHVNDTSILLLNNILAMCAFIPVRLTRI